MYVVRPASYDGVELASGGMAEFGAELVLQQRELRGSFGRNVYQRTGDGLIVVIHSLDHEVVVHRTLAADRGSSPLTHAAVARDTRAQQRQVQGAEQSLRVLDDREIDDCT